ncbi:acyl-CoA dehydrogenase family protein [Nocardia sp. NPDC005745]|uniref:acyl-CoA dehydrogenase family protein n=1 Tax=Nocardia sp. NPDC005745 TaxID=3157061 RepID=UPI0033C7BB64
MNLDPSDEQRVFAAALRQFLDDADPLRELRDAEPADSPFDRKIWSRLANEIGLHGILLPQAVGGSEGDLLDAVAAFEELGRSLLSGPYVASLVQAPNLLAAAEAEQGAEWSAQLAQGELVVTVPFERTDVKMAGGGTSTGSVRVSGAVGPLPFAAEADLLLLVTTADELVAVPLGERPPIETHVSIDPTQRFGTVTLDNTPGVLLAHGVGVASAHDRALTQAATALAAEQVGAAGKCLETAQAYAKERTQFARPIGSFQAVKHLLVDVFIELTFARRATWLAAWELENGVESRLPRAAWSQAATTLQLAATTSVQVHGGIAITWEHDAHWYLKRAVAFKALFGSPAQHHDALGGELVHG